MDIVYLIYGFAFLALGLVIVVRLEHESTLEMLDILWLLAAFAIAHGVLEWMVLWHVIHTASAVQDLTEPALLLVSYLFLFEFGRRLVSMASAVNAKGKSIGKLLGIWLYAPMLAGILAGTTLSDQPILALFIWSRYLCGFPASFLAGAGFLLYWHNCIKPTARTSDFRTIRLASQVASAAFLAYAVFGGLIANRADWFPASVVNQDTFLSAFGVPVQLLRAICAVLIAVSVGALLRIFHIEGLLRLRDALGATERALGDLRKRESLLSSSPVVLYTGAPTTPFGATFISQNVRQIMGYAPEQFTQDAGFWLKNIHPEDQSRILGGLAALTEHGSYQYEYRFRASDGSYRWMNGEMRLLREAAGSDAKLVGYWADITKRKHAEAELSEQRAIFSTILASASEAIFAKDLDGKYRFMNEAGAQILGYKAIDVIGRTDADLLPAHLASAFRRVDERVISTGETHVNEPVGVAKDKRRALIARKTPWRNHLGEIVGVIGVSTDITERKDAEDALRKTIAFSESLSEAMPLPVFHKDSSGRYTGCNSAFARFIGKAKSEIVGKTVFEVSPQHFASTYKDKDLELLSDPIGNQTYESRVAHADGSVRDVIFHKARLADSDGNPIGIVGIITDITELKQIHARQVSLEAQLRESQKMEALGTLAGGVAHDFNNIVTAIIGNTELACQDVGLSHPAVVSLDEIRKASRRAKDLVQQILAFGRRQRIDRKVIALAPVVEESARLLRASMLGAVTLNVSCVDEVPLVLADPTQIQQVLLNLGGNAWHAVEDQGSAGAIEILLAAKVRSGNRFASLTVRDNGRGMDEATRSRIFEPFFTTKPEGKGTGLGLSVVHSILAEHGANIEVSSAPGEGATFTIHFPEAQLPRQAVPAPAPLVEEVHGQGAHVLYVDDDEAIVFLITRLLERQGYRVSGYTEAKLALDAVRANPGEFDLVVTDYSMPGMSGIDVARAIRDLQADLPVAVASGYITDELRKDAPAAGVLELIYKPDTVEDFCVAVARLAQTTRAKSIRSPG